MDRKKLLLTPAFLLAALLSLPAGQPAFPGTTWQSRTPAAEGLDAAKLDALARYLGGRGCVIRNGFLVYSWGDISTRGDVASAAKPWFSTFLFKAVEEGRIPGVDTPVLRYQPGLGALNAALSHKDTNITFRHFANQTSCYGVQERPGTAFDYNDWQMSLFWDTLFLVVYGATYATVDAAVLQPKLTGILQCQDSPTFLAFGKENRPGRLSISPRDFARFGLLYLNHGNWNGTQVISYSNATMAVSSPLPLSVPRTAGLAAEMLPGQRSMGSRKIPDDQTDHDGSYSWLWWVNGVQRNGQRKWPAAPTDVYACLGHANGKRGMAVMPSRQIVISWNDTRLDTYPSDPHPLNPVLQYLVEGVTNPVPQPLIGQIVADPGHPNRMVYHAVYQEGRLKPCFFAGPGDPKDLDFMESATLLNTLVPRDDLAGGATQWLLANPGVAYIACATHAGAIGIKSILPGTYRLRWLDIPAGTTFEQTSTVLTSGARSWSRPAAIGSETAVYIVNESCSSPAKTTEGDR